ncbi:MAG: veratrol--corrinoid protein metyltransferase [Clostridiales Family XIII bacterium]|jgi:hypothetical protein|nr:veratrol--corrinoid protein metyltransferase [Clostridiales Family XIII bacterium]
MLTEKENYLMTLRGEQPEFISSYTFGPMPGQTKPVANHMFEPPIINQHRANNGGPDIWGVNYVPTESTGNALIPDNSVFILSLDDLPRWREIIKAPDIEGVDWEKLVTKQIEESGIDRTQTAMALNLHMGYFQTLMSFTGFEDGLIAFYEEPEAVHEIMEYLSEFYMAVADKVIDIYKPDVLTFMDDTAAWNSPFISPEMYREFVLPHHEKWAKRGRERGLLMTMHNCGKSESVMEMVHNMGITAWDPAQTCNDLDAVQAKFGNGLVIMGGWDGRGRLLEADVTEEEIRQSVRDSMDRYAVGGGYCWCGGFLGAVGDQEILRKNMILFDEVGRYSLEFYKTH